MTFGWEIKNGFIVSLDDGTTKGLLSKFYRILRTEPFQYETGKTSGTAEFSSVTAGSSSGFKQIKVLEPDDEPVRIGWFEWGVQDSCEYKLKLQPGVARLGPDQDKEVGYVNNIRSPYYAPNPLLGFWLFADWFPAIDAKNISPVSLTPQVFFLGTKFDIEEIKDVGVLSRIKAEGKYTIITLGGVTP